MSKTDNRVQVLLNTNSLVDEGAGHITFTNGLVLSDESEQKNGTSYDIASMNINEYSGDVFLDHEYTIENLVGKAYGIAKQGGKLIAKGIKFAVDENPKASFLYKMVRNGYARAVSIGTQGALDDDGIYRNARLLEFSFVGIGNNDNAVINSADVYGDDFKNSIERAIANGLDAPVENNKLNINKDKVMSEVKNDVAVAEEAPAVKETPEASAPVTAEQVSELKSELNALKDLFNNSSAPTAIHEAPTTVLEPTISVNTFAEKAKAMSQKERSEYQVKALWNEKKNGRMSRDMEAMYTAVNAANIEDIKKSKVAKYVPTISQNAAPVIGMDDESGFGHWVPCVDYFEEVETCKTNYDAINSRFGFDQSDKCYYAWSLTSGDVDMQPVAKCDSGDDENLKPIVGSFDNAPQIRQMIEFAGVTPFCNAATIFLAGDLLGTVAQEYAYDYRRKQAGFVVGAIQQAIDLHVAGLNGVNGTPIVPANPDASSVWDGTATGLGSALRQLCGCCPGGVLLFNCETEFELMKLCSDCGDGAAFGNGNVSESGTIGRIWGKSYVIVPNELMPTLGSGATTTVAGVDPVTGAATTVTVTHAIVCIDPRAWKGVTNGGFRYDVRGDVAYEVNGAVRSAYQRDELVARGYFFLGGGIKDPSCVVGILA